LAESGPDSGDYENDRGKLEGIGKSEATAAAGAERIGGLGAEIGLEGLPGFVGQSGIEEFQIFGISLHGANDSGA